MAKRLNESLKPLWHQRGSRVVREPNIHGSQITYLESTGTQYIDTGIYGTSNLNFEVCFEFASKSSTSDANSATIFGARQSYMSRGFQLGTFSSGTMQWAGTLHRGIGVTEVNTKYVVKLSGSSVYVNGVHKATVGSSTFDTPTTLLIFALQEPTEIKELLSGRIYYLKLFDKTSGDLIADFIPVRVGQTGYLYDTVTGKLLGNAGTGDFILGPDVNFAFNPLLLKRRRGLMAAATEPIIHLPAGYTRVDYLNFDGTAYIDLGYGANEATDAAYIDFMITPTVTAQMRLLSANESNTAATMYVSGSLGISFRWHNQSGYISGGRVGTAGVRHTSYIDYSASGRRAVFDGVQKSTTMNGSTTSYAQSTNSHYLVCGPATTNARFKGRVYEVKTWRNGVLFRHLVPCKDANNVGHMYDVKNGVMYSNAASSGALTPGIESEYLYEFPAELTKHNGAVSADSTHGAYIDTNSKRRSFVLQSGVLALPLHPYQGGADEWSTSNYYPIPIPQNAVSVTLSITPSTAYIGPRFVYIDNGIYATAVDGNPGWMQGTNTITIPAGSTHICINTKYNSAGDSYPTDMPTAVKVQFNTE